MLWQDKIKCLIETTTYCNAKCPQCSRTNPNGLGYSNIAPLKHVTMKEWLDSYAKSYEWIGSFHLSVRWGDAFMNPEIKDIIEHIVDNSTAWTSFCTNASMRDGDFWWDIGAKLHRRGSGTFDVDGWTQESHEMYRRNTNLKLVKENIEAFAATGTTTSIQTIVFKHNQHEVDSIREWAESIGADHQVLQSNRFKEADTFGYSYKGKEYVLEQTTDSKYLEKFSDDIAIRDHRHKGNITNNITCRWGERSKVFVDEYLNVWPCCFWHIRHHRFNHETNLYNKFMGDQYSFALRGDDKKTYGITNRVPAPSGIFADFVAQITAGEFNLKNKTMDQIMSHEFYSGGLEDSFTDKPAGVCRFMCGALKLQDELPLE